MCVCVCVCVNGSEFKMREETFFRAVSGLNTHKLSQLASHEELLAAVAMV